MVVTRTRAQEELRIPVLGRQIGRDRYRPIALDYP